MHIIKYIVMDACPIFFKIFVRSCHNSSLSFKPSDIVSWKIIGISNPIQKLNMHKLCMCLEYIIQLLVVTYYKMYLLNFLMPRTKVDHLIYTQL